MSKTAYKSELHTFIKGYFDACNAKIIEQQDNFFIVELPDGIKKTYTYIAKVAAENKDICLLAKGSKELNDIMSKCTSKAAFSEVHISYNAETVKTSLTHKECCDLCPFFTICDYKEKCCDFCSYYKSCNTSILNADFVRLGNIKESKPLNIICFIFLVELSNDYSLSHKSEKLVPVLINLDTDEPMGSIRVDDLIGLDMNTEKQSIDENIPLTDKQYRFYMNVARQKVFETIKNQLEVFKKEIEGVLNDKISSIVNKYEEEYIDNYTKTTLLQLNNLQEDALKLCEREIRGYAINCDYRLKNVILMHTTKDVREVFLKLHETGAEIVVSGQIFLNNIEIKCSECNTEIDIGTLCEQGHTACKTCMEICSACGTSICNVCDDEGYICSTCGEIICAHCVTKCASCGVILCPSHGYRCTTCGKIYCIECYEICEICGDSICTSHINKCSKCDAFVCSNHIHKCSVCNELFCDNDIYKCSICNSNLCQTHAVKSSYSKQVVCSEHSGLCSVCANVFALNELEQCTLCSSVLCPDHKKVCVSCNKVYCSEHINHCTGCGKDYCSCTHVVRCKLCQETYCPECVNSKNLCKACSSLALANKEEDLLKAVFAQVPEIANYQKFYLGRASETNVLYSKNIVSGCFTVFDDNGRVISNKKISILGFLKRRFVDK